MRRGLTACLCAVALLTGCGKSYWTESCGDCEVTLRDSGNTEKAVEIVVTVDGEETILKTLAVPAERISAEAFTDILGYSGFRLTERQGLAVQDPAPGLEPADVLCRGGRLGAADCRELWMGSATGLLCGFG